MTRKRFILKAGVQELQELQEFRSSGVQEFKSREPETRSQKSEVERKGSSHSVTPELLQLLNSCYRNS
jgi:hypothetical protein